MSEKELVRLPLAVTDRHIVVAFHDFRAANLSKQPAAEAERYGRNTPGVYCFFDEDEIYIGESMHPFTRLKQHATGRDTRLDGSKEVRVYASPQLSKSSVYHVEGELIQLAAAYKAELFPAWRTLLNANRDRAPRLNGGRYFLKDQYDGLAERIWQQWLESSLVNAEASFVYKTTHYVNSPYKNLNAGQGQVMGELLTNWSQHPLTVVTGFPGTGKSVLAATLFNTLLEKHAIAFTSGTAPSLQGFQKMFRHAVKGTDSAVVKLRDLLTREGASSPFDLVIVDEGHRLLRKSAKGHPGKVSHIPALGTHGEGNELSMLVERYKHVVVFYDQNQNVHSGDFPAVQVFAGLTPHLLELTVQERLSEQAADYISRLFAFLDGQDVSGRYDGRYPVTLYDNFALLVSDLRAKAKGATGRHAALLAGFTRPWLTDPKARSKGAKPDYDFDLAGVRLCWNSRFDRWFSSQPAKLLQEVAYYRVVQGMETDFTGVIVGLDLCWDPVSEKLYADPAYVMNESEKPNWARMKQEGLSRQDYERELLRLVTNRYKILLTRAVAGVFVYVENVPLRAKFKALFAVSPAP